MENHTMNSSHRPVPLRQTLLILGMLIACLCATAFAQVPPPPPLPPLPPFPFPGPANEPIPDILSASSKQVESYVQHGFEEGQTGKPPYGLDTDGKPLWPIEKRYPNGLASAPEPAAPANDLSNPAVGGKYSPDRHTVRMAELRTRGSFQPTTVRPLVQKDLSTGSGNQGLSNAVSETLSAEEVRRLRFSFLYDIERFARFEYEGAYEKALGLALKWKILGRRHAAQIDEITDQIAQKQGQGLFSSWIAGVITRLQGKLPAK